MGQEGVIYNISEYYSTEGTINNYLGIIDGDKEYYRWGGPNQ